MRTRTVVAAAVVACAGSMLVGHPAAAAAAPCLSVPSVVQPTLPADDPLGATAERLAVSHVPGPVANTEVVRVAVDDAGSPTSVSVDQTLALTGDGDYVIYERGPARSVDPLGATAPPTLKLGRVTWAGYVPRAESLAASIGLDPAIEAARLPLRVAVTGASVTLTNATVLPAETLDVGPVPAQELAAPLDLLAREARSHDPRPAVAGDGLPTAFDCDGGTPTGSIAVTTVAPLRITGSLAPGAPSLDGVLGSVPVTFSTPAFAPTLTASPTLDPRTLRPPAGFASWSAWAASGPDATARTAATATLMSTAAAAARIREIEPYLAADLPGTASTSFTFAVRRMTLPAPSIAPVRARPVPIALAALTALLLVGTSIGLARRL